MTSEVKNKRREFLKQTGLIVAGLTALPKIEALAYPGLNNIGLQLYSLRNEFKTKSVEEIISHVAKAGYKFVESYGYTVKNGFWGLTAKEFKTLLDKYRLTSNGGHYDFNEWEKRLNHDTLEAYISTAKTLKQKYIIVPYINPDIFKSEKKVLEFAEKLKVTAEIVKKAGLKLAYHNHAFEFTDLGGGKTGYEILLKEINPSLIDFEIDLYWAVRAKQDVLKMFKEHPGRFTMWHIKDIRKSDPTKNTEIGNGTIDFSVFLKEAKLAGLKYPIIEQENFEIDPFESIRRSINFVKALK